MRDLDDHWHERQARRARLAVRTGHRNERGVQAESRLPKLNVLGGETDFIGGAISLHRQGSRGRTAGKESGDQDEFPSMAAA
jgi:hypothetical protein